MRYKMGELASFDDEEVLGVDLAVLREVEVFLRNEYALCGDRVSAYPLYAALSRENLRCAIAIAREEILTSEEVPEVNKSVTSQLTTLRKCKKGIGEGSSSSWIISREIPISIVPLYM